VAAFGYAIRTLGSLAELICELATAGKPLLGICVGHQLLFESSVEKGSHRGLALIQGSVVPIPAGRTIPHMGWNQVRLNPEIDLFRNLPETRHFYFAHSFYAEVTDPDAHVATTDYGFDLPAAVRKNNIYGTQFHPEKSGPAGLELLKNFADIAERSRS
jgi:glutamine amidotransferase